MTDATSTARQSYAARDSKDAAAVDIHRLSTISSRERHRTVATQKARQLPSFFNED